jgi:HEAT repeat protein
MTFVRLSAIFTTVLIACLASSPAAEPDALPIVLELLHSPDRDTRGLALQQIRDGLPGETVTRKLTEQLPSLSMEGQAALLEALGDRGDRTARPALLKAATNPNESVRIAALSALPTVADPADVPILVGRAALGSQLEQQTARRSLVRLRGDGIDKALITALDGMDPKVTVETLRVLAVRKVSEAMPKVLECAAHHDPGVRLAALLAAQPLAQASHTPALIRLVVTAHSDSERNAAEAALLGLSAREGARCLDPILTAMHDAPDRVQMVLLQALAAIGGPKALQTTCDSVQAGTSPVRDEAARILSEWPDPTAQPCLLQMAEQPTNAVHQVLGLRGLVRLASAQEKQAVNVALLCRVWQLASRTEEKRLVLGALSASATAESLALAAQAMREPELAEEAAVAAVQIAESLPRLTPASRQALEQARERMPDPAVRARADKVLQRGSANATSGASD